ncbi:unnamed protein product [Ectocarpus fasciculatus]
MTVTALLYGLFVYWYVGQGQPVTTSELKAMLSSIPLKSKINKEDLYNLAAVDTGGEFYMVNLIKWNKAARYPVGSPLELEVDPMAANDRYAKMIGPELLKRASFPVFQSSILANAIVREEGDTTWDTVVVVRYRSFRDFIDVYASILQSGAIVHKFAAIDKTHVMPTRITPMFGYFVPVSVLLLLFFIATVLSSCCN